MRLTLRTLLAYLDDILDPADKEELSRKIESSEFAEDLVHRTRDTMRRLRLSAPQVVGVGMGLDPNTVADYLDNVLPPEQVGDFERICLESDVHLAEVAACHHVLTMVLGEPADVDPRARQRMYGMPTEARERKRMRAEPAHGMETTTAVVSAAAPVMPAAAPVAPRAVVSQPSSTFEVPDYLRAKSWWQSRGVLAALAATLLIGMGILVSGLSGWFGNNSNIASLNTETPAPLAGAPAVSAAEQTPPPIATEPVPPVAEAPANIASQQAAPPAVGETPDRYAVPAGPPEAAFATDAAETATTETAPAIEAPATNTTEDVAATAAIPPQSVATPLVNEVPIPPQTENAPVAALPAAPPLTDPSVPEDDTTRVAAATPSVPGAIEEVATLEAGAESIALPDETAVVIDRPTVLGTYLGAQTVLLRRDAETGAWLRVEPRNAVIAGERLLALPEFRPKVTLAAGMQLDLSGGTQITLLTADEVSADGLPDSSIKVPAVELVYGRIVLINTSNVENTLRLKLGPYVGDAQLAHNATLAIELERPFVPGVDPRKETAPVIARFYVPDGGVKWRDASGEIVTDSASRWTIEKGVTSEAAADPAPPEWIDQEPVLHLSEQKYGAPIIESTLVSDRPADIQLLELFKGTGRKEVKSLAARSSIHVGLFAPFIAALRDSDLRWPTWQTHVETLRAAMVQSPESAAMVYLALVDERDRPAADDLYEMLCGYSAEQIGKTPEDIKSGALLTLIDYLESDSLDYRVLAVYDLREITGKMLMQNPAAAASIRKQNVNKWRMRLESGELKPVERE